MLRSSAWRGIEAEYNVARDSLSILAKESGTLGSGAEELIINLDIHFHRLQYRMNQAVPLSQSLVAPLPPPINRFKVKGILAYRAWKMDIKGSLSPSIIRNADTWENEVAFADQPPTTYNQYGLHATRIEYWNRNSYNTQGLSGIVDLFGKVVEHSDGVMRAECARVKTIFILVDSTNELVNLITGVYELMHHQYPNTPIYMMNSHSLELYIWREVLITIGAVRC